jgi:hypothetical protein
MPIHGPRAAEWELFGAAFACLVPAARSNVILRRLDLSPIGPAREVLGRRDRRRGSDRAVHHHLAAARQTGRNDDRGQALRTREGIDVAEAAK